MGVAVTLGAQAQRECRQDEKRHSLFGGSEEESLPRLIEFETPVRFQLQFHLTTNGPKEARIRKTSRSNSNAIPRRHACHYTIQPAL